MTKGINLANFLKDKWDNKKCPMCGGNWSVASDEAGNLHILHMYGRTFPLTPIMCQNCGNTLLVNVKENGFLASEKEQENAV